MVCVSGQKNRAYVVVALHSPCLACSLMGLHRRFHTTGRYRSGYAAPCSPRTLPPRLPEITVVRSGNCFGIVMSILYTAIKVNLFLSCCSYSTERTLSSCVFDVFSLGSRMTKRPYFSTASALSVSTSRGRVISRANGPQ